MFVAQKPAAHLLLLCMLGCAGCIPSAPPADPSELATPPAGVRPAGAEMPASTNAAASVEPAPDGNGYLVSGSYGLAGTIQRGAAGWLLNATFTFPTGGYAVGEPFITALEKTVQDPAKDLVDFRGSVIINIPIGMPPKDAVVTQALQEVPLSLTIPAHEEATFMVLLVNG